jgi:hypothetical protein
MKELLPAPAFPGDEITILARRYVRANRGVMALINRFGGKVEAQMKLLPEPARAMIDTSVEAALTRAYGLAQAGGRLGRTSGRTQTALAGISGAVGGFAGLPGAIAELPLTITMILRAIQDVAEAYGFDPDAEPTRREILRVFGSGSPLSEDDGVNTSFIGARLTLNGPALGSMIATVAPRLSAALGQKLAAQMVPVLGAVSGAALNMAFVNYYREMAHVRFGLLAMGLSHGPDRVLAAFEAAVPQHRPILRA